MPFSNSNNFGDLLSLENLAENSFTQSSPFGGRISPCACSQLYHTDLHLSSALSNELYMYAEDSVLKENSVLIAQRDLKIELFRMKRRNNQNPK